MTKATQGTMKKIVGKMDKAGKLAKKYIKARDTVEDAKTALIDAGAALMKEMNAKKTADAPTRE